MFAKILIQSRRSIIFHFSMSYKASILLHLFFSFTRIYNPNFIRINRPWGSNFFLLKPFHDQKCRPLVCQTASHKLVLWLQIFLLLTFALFHFSTFPHLFLFGSVMYESAQSKIKMDLRRVWNYSALRSITYI